MDIIKKNILSFICAIVAIIALIASFWPLGGQYADLEKQLNARKGVYTQADSLLRKERTQPTVDPKAQEKVPLTVFPNPKVIAAGETAVTQLSAQAAKIMETAVELNRKEILVQGSLPEPIGDQPVFEFTRRYRDTLINVLPNEVLKGGSPPTEEDIKRESDKLWQEEFAPDEAAAKAGASGRNTNQRQVQDQFNEAVAKLPEQIQQRIAKEKLIYVEPGAFDVSPTIPEREKPDSYHIWYAQVGLWVQDDVARSIAAANANATNVLDAPVKRLIKLDIVEQSSGATFVLDKGMGGGARGGAAARGGAMGGRMGGGMGGGMGYDAPAPAGPGGPIKKDFTVTPTGRISSTSNSLYDVVHFSLDLVVDSSSVPRVIEELGRNKLVTVLRLDEMTSVDAAIDQAMGYMYGEKPVVQISLFCEALFLRDWTRDLMPEKVKQELGVQPAAPAEAAGGVAGVMR